MRRSLASRLVRLFASLLAMACLWLAPAHAQSAGPAIAAASDLKFALEDVARAYKSETGADVRLTFGSSGNFFRQIMQGAPFEIFLSADEDFVRQLARANRTETDGDLYAIGRIVLFAPAGSPLIVKNGLTGLRDALASGRIARFAIANPDHAPYGRAAREALQTHGLWDKLGGKLVLGENVSQAAQFATSGSTQGGIFAYSLALNATIGGKGAYILIPETDHPPLRQRMVLVKNAGADARAFYDYLRSPAANAILQRHGFQRPGHETEG